MQVIFHSMWLALPVSISFNHSAVSLSHASTHYFSHFYLTHLHPLVHNLYFPADPIFFLSNSLSLTRTHTHPYTHTPTHPHFTTLAISFSISVLGRSLNLWNKHNFTHNCRWHVHPSLEQILFASQNSCYPGTRNLKCFPSVSFTNYFYYLQTVWPDLVKVATLSKVFGNFLTVHVLFCKFVTKLGKFSLLQMAKYWK